MEELTGVTVQDGAGGRRAAPGATPGAEVHTLALPAPEQVLREAEIEQTRRTAIAGVVFNALGLVAIPFLGGDATARTLCTISLVLAGLNNGWLLYVASSARRYREWHMVLYFALAAVFNHAIIYYLGVFGPVVVMLVLNLYSACLGYGVRVARASLVGGMTPIVLLGAATTAGVIEDPGLITVAPFIGPIGRAAVILAFVLFFVLVYQQARAARALMMSSLLERDEAVRRASHREALFLEARQDLERALQAGGLGRFTEQTLGSYRLGAVLGRGGMGEVYEAAHVETGAPAAVKMLLPEALGRPDDVRRFMREVRVASSLDSPHVVKVLEVGGESAPLPYLAMERLRGEDLAQMLRRVTRLKPREVVDLVRQVGSGLEAAAAAGIVHRDLKPHNVFAADAGVERPGERVWKILDFGVSKLVDQGSSLTLGEVLGTPQYMAPEQAKNADVDARTDLYALGTIVYRALTGHPPFGGRDISEVIVAVLTEMPVRPSGLIRVHADVDLVLAVALAKDPAARFTRGAELADALEAALAGQLPDDIRARGKALLATLAWREPA